MEFCWFTYFIWVTATKLSIAKCTIGRGQLLLTSPKWRKPAHRFGMQFLFWCVNGGSYTMCDITHRFSCDQWIYWPSFKLTTKRIDEKSNSELTQRDAMVTPFHGDGNFPLLFWYKPAKPPVNRLSVVFHPVKRNININIWRSGCCSVLVDHLVSTERLQTKFG